MAKKKIDKLPEGMDLDAIARTWIAIGLDTGGCDRPKMEEAVKEVYRSQNMEVPEVIVWAESPYAGIKLAASLEKEIPLEKVDKLPTREWEELRNGILQNVVYGQHEAGWISHIKTLVDIGAELTPEQHRWLNAMEILTGTGWWIPYDEAVVMTERPTEIHLDAQGRLHNIRGAAVKYMDGWSLYSVHGVRVQDWIIETPEKITVKKIMDETNVEVRRVMCELMGWDIFIEKAKLKLLDECPDPGNDPNTLKLYEAPDGMFGTINKIMLCTNATPERDGTVRQYIITVPNEITTAVGAAAWSFDEPVEKYSQLERAT